MLHPVAEILRSSATQLPRKRMFDAYIMLHCFAEQFALDYKIEKSQVNTSRVYDPTIPQFSPINAGQQPTADTVPEEYAQSDEEEEDEVESSGEDEANGSGASAVAEDASIVDPESAENTIAGANDSSALLSPICMSLSDEIGVDVIRAAQHDFFHALLDLKTSVRQKDDTVVEKQLGSDGAANATNFFFRDCMGLQVMRRLTETIDAHNSNPQLFASRCATRAAHLVQDEEVPFRIRRFFGSVLAVVRSQAPKPIQAIYQMQQHIELLAEYNKLVEELGAGATSENAKFLIKKGYSTSRGRGWASAARLYLQDSLALTKGQVNNLINNAYVLTRIVKLFGRGMLLVLPRNAVKQYVAPLASACWLTFCTGSRGLAWARTNSTMSSSPSNAALRSSLPSANSSTPMYSTSWRAGSTSPCGP
jgi:hypothetical protein